MAQFVLEILDGDRAGEVVSLAATLRIGRKPANDLVIADEKASGVHAEIVPEGDRFVLRDLGSTNGTFLDSRRVTEVVLSAGDTFSIGRVRLRFRAEGQDASASGAAGDDGLTVGRLDTARLQAQKPKSSVALLAVLLVAAAGGGGGYVWWRGQQQAGDGPVAQGPSGPLQVEGNKLENGACEVETGWDLHAAGKAFTATTRGHTGAAAFEAVAAAGEPDFAVATTTAPVTVLAGHAVVLAAHVRTEGAARIAARLHFTGSGGGAGGNGGEPSPFQFRSGTALQGADKWTRITATVAVPPEADRVQVEIVATLPNGGVAQFDDVAITDLASGGELVQRKPEEAAATLIGTASSLAIRSEPATLLGITPIVSSTRLEPGLQGLQDAGLLALSDLGGKVTVDGDARGVSLAIEGVDGVQLWFPADSAGALLVHEKDGFAAKAAAGSYTTDALLLGDRSTRCMLTFADGSGQQAAVELQGSVQKGRFKLQAPAGRIGIALGFRKENAEAKELLRTVRTDVQEGRPGQALDRLRELQRKLPHDSETLAQAATLRGELQEKVAERLRAIGSDLDEAEFFTTRGGFERAVRDLDEVLQVWGEQNLPDAAAVAAMHKRAADALAQIDGQRAADERQRLLLMASAFEQAQKADLSAMVKDYVTRHLPGGN